MTLQVLDGTVPLHLHRLRELARMLSTSQRLTCHALCATRIARAIALKFDSRLSRLFYDDFGGLLQS